MAINWRAVIISGLIAGFVFMMLEMILVAAVGGASPWGPPRMIAAMVMGKDVLPPPASFDTSIFIVAMVVHFVLSFILAAVFAWAADASGWSVGTCIIAGLVFGLLVYVIDFYVMTAVFPWFAKARTPVTIFSHAMFGLVLGWVYRSMAPARAVVRET